MAKFNTAERLAAKFLSRFPGLKESLKALYQRVSHAIYKKDYSVRIHYLAALKRVSEKGKTAFWGYYDKSPSNEKMCCYHQVGENLSHSRRSTGQIDIVCGGKVISSTNTWNWQQGAMLTWLDDSKVIHNIYETERYKSKIVDVHQGTTRTLDFPIYSLARSGAFALSLNFARLANLRPDYGYFVKPYEYVEPMDPNDGIYWLSLEDGSKRLIISFEELIGFHPRVEFTESSHKVNHLEINPNDTRFIFHHRWYSKGGLKKSRLISANVDGSDMFLLADDDMVSHCTWKNDYEIMGWMRHEGQGDRYFQLHDKSDVRSIIGGEVLTEDGHPSVSKDGKWMLTDTYPDKARMSMLLLFNLENQEIFKLGEFYSPLQFRGELRCDLHPRFSPEMGKVTFDSVHEGYRAMYEMDITKIIAP